MQQLNPHQEQYLTTVEISRALSVCRGTVWRLIQDGSLPAIKIGRGYRVPVSEFLRYKGEQVQSEDTSTSQLHQLIEEWLNHLRNGVRPFSPKTVDDYGYNFRIFLRTIGGHQ
jgi:excisionase family DNA binding protein